MRDALERWPYEVCLIEADRERENCRLTYRQFKEAALPALKSAAGPFHAPKVFSAMAKAGKPDESNHEHDTMRHHETPAKMALSARTIRCPLLFQTNSRTES